MTYVCWYFSKDELKYAFNPMVYGALLGVAVILDISWLWIHTGELWGEEYVDAFSQKGLRKFTLVISYLLLLAEVGLSYNSVWDASWGSVQDLVSVWASLDSSKQR